MWCGGLNWFVKSVNVTVPLRRGLWCFLERYIEMLHFLTCSCSHTQGRTESWHNAKFHLAWFWGCHASLPPLSWVPPQFVLLTVSKILVPPQAQKILKVFGRWMATQNQTVPRHKSDNCHPNLAARVSTQPNSKKYSSLTRVFRVVDQKQTAGDTFEDWCRKKQSHIWSTEWSIYKWKKNAVR